MTSRFAARLLPYGTLLTSNIEELGKLRSGDGTESETLWDIHVLGSQSRAQFYWVVDAPDKMDEEDSNVVRRLAAVADRHSDASNS